MGGAQEVARCAQGSGGETVGNLMGTEVPVRRGEAESSRSVPDGAERGTMKSSSVEGGWSRRCRADRIKCG